MAKLRLNRLSKEQEHIPKNLNKISKKKKRNKLHKSAVAYVRRKIENEFRGKGKIVNEYKIPIDRSNFLRADIAIIKDDRIIIIEVGEIKSQKLMTYKKLNKVVEVRLYTKNAEYIGTPYKK